MFPSHWPLEVILELTDADFAARTHGRKSTYQAGCHGPLCKWVERTSRRAYYAKKREEAGLQVRSRRRPDPAIDEALLRRIFEAHVRERGEERQAFTA